MSKSLNEGAILHRDFAVDSWYWNIYAQSGRFDMDKPLAEYTDEEWRLLLFGADGKIALRSLGRRQGDQHGLRGRRDRSSSGSTSTPDRGARPTASRRSVARFTTSVRCPDCGGTRLAEAARTATVDGRTLPDALPARPGLARRLAAGRSRDAEVAPLVDEALGRRAAPSSTWGSAT